jgi:hypothetical protein
MAALGYQHKGGLFLVPPVSTNITVSLMPKSDLFQLIDCLNSANTTAINNGFHSGEPFVIAHGMTYAGDDSIASLGRGDFLTILEPDRHRFFQEHMIPFVHARHSRFDMILIHSSYYHRIAEPVRCNEFPPSGKAIRLRYPMLLLYRFAVRVARFCNRNNGRQMRIVTDNFGKSSSAPTRTNNSNFNHYAPLSIALLNSFLTNLQGHSAGRLFKDTH